MELEGIAVLTMEGEERRKAKPMLKPCFAKEKIDNMAFTSAMMDALIAKIPADGDTVDMFRLLRSTACA